MYTSQFILDTTQHTNDASTSVVILESPSDSPQCFTASSQSPHCPHSSESEFACWYGLSEIIRSCHATRPSAEL